MEAKENNIRNTNLYNAIRLEYRSALSFSKANNLSPTTVSKFIRDLQSPLLKDGRSVSIPAKAVCKALKKDFKYLFPKYAHMADHTEKRDYRDILDGWTDNMSHTKDPSYEIENLEFLKQLETALCNLTDRERKVLEMRFGLGDHIEEHRKNEIAKIHQVSNARIKQIEVNALRKLRDPTIRKELENYHYGYDVQEEENKKEIDPEEYKDILYTIDYIWYDQNNRFTKSRPYTKGRLFLNAPIDYYNREALKTMVILKTYKIHQELESQNVIAFSQFNVTIKQGMNKWQI